MLSQKQIRKLYDCAKKASAMTYSPYSRFAVGASALTKRGKIFSGANIENASYGLTVCAERVAVCNAVSKGYRDIVAVAVSAGETEATPCGACRQFIFEFGEDIEVIYKEKGKIISRKIADLLPGAFSLR